MSVQAEHTIDLPITDAQAQILMHEVTLQPLGMDLAEPAKVSHGILLGGMFLPGRWSVYAVRQEYLNGAPQHYASLRWQP